MTQGTGFNLTPGDVLGRFQARVHAAHAAGRDVLGWFGSSAEVAELLGALNGVGHATIGPIPTPVPTRPMGPCEAPRYIGAFGGVPLWEVAGGAFMLGEARRETEAASTPSIGELDARAVARAREGVIELEEALRGARTSGEKAAAWRRFEVATGRDTADEAHPLVVAREMLAGGDLDALDRFLADQIERRAIR